MKKNMNVSGLETLINLYKNIKKCKKIGKKVINSLLKFFTQIMINHICDPSHLAVSVCSMQIRVFFSERDEIRPTDNFKHEKNHRGFKLLV